MTGGFGNTEINNLDLFFIGDQDVLGADIPVNDIQRAPLGIGLEVRVVQAIADLLNDVAGCIQGHLDVGLIKLAQNLEEVFSLHKLHGDVVVIFYHPHIKDLGNVAMG